MYIKKVNEEIEEFLNKSSKTKIQEKHPNNLMQKLSNDYGDLTIPEFIDMLIKDKNILDEGLSEAYSEYMDIIVQAANKVFPEVSYPSRYENYFYVGIKNSNFGIYTTNQPPIYISTMSLDPAHPEDKKFTVSFSVPRLNPKYSPWYNVDVSRVSEEKLKQLENTLRNNIKDFIKNQDLEVDNSYSLGFTVIFDDCDNLKEIINNMKWLKQILEKINSFVGEQVNEVIQEINNINNERENDYQALKRARKEARMNKNANNTTIKQALSKSAIAKKIQALQNPTPEQLAKILAAIEQ